MQNPRTTRHIWSDPDLPPVATPAPFLRRVRTRDKGQITTTPPTHHIWKSA